MPSREVEVVTYLRADSTLDTLAPGGVYALSDLTEIGITDPTYTEDVWAGGVFNTTILVREGAAQPTGDLQDTTLQHTSMSQRIEIWAYSSDPAAIDAALNHVYGLMMGTKTSGAWGAVPAGGGPGIVQAPELPTGILTHHEDYRAVFIRKPVAV